MSSSQTRDFKVLFKQAYSIGMSFGKGVRSSQSLIAGTCHLQELPDPLLYQVTSHLDVYTQRNLFLCSSQLYKTWHLQVAGDDSMWQFIRARVDLIAASTGFPVYTYGSLCFIT